MIKKLLAAAAVATLALGATAQEQMYLIKGNQVVAKYNVSDVDYVSFTLPAGVTDNTGGQPSVLSKTYKSAVALYEGTIDDVADYVVQMSTRDITDENTPVEFLYLQIMGPAADYENLSLPTGTYTVQQGEERKPYTFYAGIREITDDGEGVAGTLVLNRPDNYTSEAILVEDGSFTVEKDGNYFNIAGMLKLENGSVLEFNYAGACVVDNVSNEQPPADYLPLPESSLESNVTLSVGDVYYGSFGPLFQDKPNLNYNYVWFYNAAGTDFLCLGFIVDKSLSNSYLLPKGKYNLVEVGSSEFNSAKAAALAPFLIQGSYGPVSYGAWMTTGYSTETALVSGEIEVLEDFDGTGNLNIKVNLKDNAATPHTVSGSYNGKAEKL